MKTRLHQFCQEFDSVITPLLEPVHGVVTALGDGSQSLPVFEGLPRLRDLHHKLTLLIEKISRQQAYVLIFGPLKSGKSTLMNALTGAYVSEVTSLPAYPCLVYVSDSDDPQYVFTRYDGTTETKALAGDVRETIDRAHVELSTRMREVERTNGNGRDEGDPAAEAAERFDPGVHLPEAIRKLDVKLPAGDLRESGAVLVDTPGLYTRMKFGYDQMTREFRDTAACAVFVVKTDNLFLEQVFDEFHELLEIFGRIFLVVNLDSTKKDLSPDGSLVPSLEHENPQQIIEAFETLAMSAPIKEAAESGRLGIYPVDLLRAASARLQRKAGGDENAPVHAGFEALRRDMTEYLSSSEYIQTFVADSLRYAESLCTELRAEAASEEIDTLRNRVAELERERDEAQLLSGAAARLTRHDWRGALSAMRTQFVAQMSERSGEIATQMTRDAESLVETWFENSDSLAKLLKDDFQSLHRQLQEQIAGRVSQELGAMVHGSIAELLGLKADNVGELITLGIDVQARADQALTVIDHEAAFVDAGLEIEPHEIPVRKGLMDWVLFRSQGTLREKLFGSPQNPTKPITAAHKAKHLGPAADVLYEHARRFVEVYTSERSKTIAAGSLTSFSKDFLTSIVTEIKKRHAEQAERVRVSQSRWQQLQHVLDTFRDLESRIDEAVRTCDVVRSRYDRRESDDDEFEEVVIG